ncbi:Uncharacterised protein [Escherichia coli]|nr:Uncharacterised protein [Escherichia coli]
MSECSDHQPQTQAPDYISINLRSRWCALLLWPDLPMPHFRLYPVPVSPAPKACCIVVNTAIIHHQRKRRRTIDTKIQRAHKSIFQTDDRFSRCFGDGDWFRRAGAMSPHGDSINFLRNRAQQRKFLARLPPEISPDLEYARCRTRKCQSCVFSQFLCHQSAYFCKTCRGVNARTGCSNLKRANVDSRVH